MTRTTKNTPRNLFIAFSVFALGYCTFSFGWLNLASVRVEGNSRLSDAEIIELAALNDASDIWAFPLNRARIARALAASPLIESCQVRLSSPVSLTIKVVERKTVCALELNNHLLTFDRTGELLEILGPSELYLGRTVRGIPPGALRMEGKPISCFSKAWAVPGSTDASPANIETPQFMLTQLGRLTTLLTYLSIYAREYDPLLEEITMDEDGKIQVKYQNLPPISLGWLNDSEHQLPALLAILRNPSAVNPREVLSVDLSNMQFPHLDKRQEFYTALEKQAIMASQSLQTGSTPAPEPRPAQPEEAPADAGSSAGSPSTWFPDLSIFYLGRR